MTQRAIVFSTHSAHKLAEVQALLRGKINFLSLSDIGFHQEIPEPFETLEENAKAKVEAVYAAVNKPVFAEDTGLFVEALGGKPGVYSARYAGEPSDAEANITKLLQELEGANNRKAYFKTVICFFDGTTFHFVEGICNGTIAPQRSGTQGFGYDPVFIPEGNTLSFAEMVSEDKNKVSHRAKAFQHFMMLLEQSPSNELYAH